MEPPVFKTELSTGIRLTAAGAIYIAFAVWLKYVVARMPPGTARVLTALPVFIANVSCPCFFNNGEELLQRLSTVFILTWLCTFKVLAFCWGRTPLRESMTVSQIAAVILLPVFPRPAQRAKAGPEGRLQDTAGSGLELVGRWIAKIVLLGVVVYLILGKGDVMPRVVRHYVYAFGLYAFVGFLMDGPAALAVEALGLPLVPTFDQPWMSSSLADFWGRRWNITTSSVLRTVVYDPIVDGSLISPDHLRGQQGPTPPGQQVSGEGKQQGQARRPSLLRRQLGLHATFIVSGLVHEYIAWLVSRTGVWSWKWLLFFSIQAPLMTVEALVGKRLDRAGLRLPRWLCVLLTVALLEALAYDLFFGFVEVDTDLAPRVVAVVSASYRDLLAPLQRLVAGLVAGGRQEL